MKKLSLLLCFCAALFQLSCTNQIFDTVAQDVTDTKENALPPSAVAPRLTAADWAFVTLTWDAAPRAMSYSVYRRAAAGAYGPSPYAQASTCIWTDSQVQPGEAYFYKVAAVNANGSSPESSELTATAIGVPGIPTDLAVINFDNTKVDLSWSAPANQPGIHFEVYRSPLTESSYVMVADNLTATAYEDAAVTADTKYFYRVLASNPRGSGNPCVCVSVTASVRTPRSAPGLGAPAVSVNGSLADVALSWTAASGTVTGYTVHRLNVDTAAVDTVDVPGSGATGFTDSGRPLDTKFRYEVTAYNSYGDGPASLSKYALTPPPAPVLNTPPAGSVRTTSTTLTWTNPVSLRHGITDTILRKNGVPLALAAGDKAARQTQLTGLSANTGYGFSISASNAFHDAQLGVDLGGEGPAAAIGTVTTAPLPPTLTPSGLTSTGVTISCSTVSAAQSYSLTGSGIISGVQTFTVSSLAAYTDYTYKGCAVSSSWLTDEASLTVRTLAAAPAFQTPTRTSSSIALSWAAVSGAASYRVTGDASATPASNSYTHGSLTPCRLYTYTVCAVDGLGRNGMTASVSYWTRPVAAALTQDAGATTSTSIALVVGANGNVNPRYQIIVNGGNAIPLTAGQTTYADTASEATGKSYVVRTLNTDGADAVDSGAATFYSKTGVPSLSAPSGQDVRNTTVTLRWTAPSSGVTSYTVETRDSGAVLLSSDTGISGATTAWPVSGLTKGTTYQFRVIGVNQSGLAGTPASRSVTTCSITMTSFTKTGAVLTWTHDQVGKPGDPQAHAHAITVRYHYHAVTNPPDDVYTYSTDGTDTLTIPIMLIPPGATIAGTRCTVDVNNGTWYSDNWVITTGNMF
jgi:hypothetical protein